MGILLGLIASLLVGIGLLMLPVWACWGLFGS
jgi:hypothetical protein